MGLVLWASLLAWRWGTGAFHEFALAESLFLLSPLVLVPLGLPLSRVPHRAGQRSRLFGVVLALHSLGALGLLPAFAAGLPWQFRAALGVPYLLFSAAAALHGLARLAGRSELLHEEAAIDFALLCLPVGAVWMLAYLAEATLAGFSGL
ncbi:MAG TPA: YndJ family transporter, partial [Myxococcaceae bacterium]